MNKRQITHIFVHCTATLPTASVDSLRAGWKSIGWSNLGYHYVVKPSGEVVSLQPEEKASNGVRGHKPTLEEIRDTIVMFHNGQVDAKILSGFSWKDMPVWLSSENQFNYKASFDLAVQTNGQNLPVRFKFGTDKDPKYYDFKTVDELSDFYTSAIKFINDMLQEGWAEKDSVDFSVYSI